MITLFPPRTHKKGIREVGNPSKVEQQKRVGWGSQWVSKKMPNNINIYFKKVDKPSRGGVVWQSGLFCCFCYIKAPLDTIR